MKLGLDIGGTKIEAAVLDAGGAIRFQRRRATPRSYAGILSVVQHLVEEAEKTMGCSLTVGVGSPGAISPQTGLMQNAENIEGLNGGRLDKDLESALDRPVRLANDADCFALSEAVDGAAAGGSLVLGVILGTGCGGGLVVERKLVRGVNAAAGEWGHNGLPWPDASEFPAPACICGKRGCMELYLSGPGMSRDHLDRTGERLSAPVIVDRARKGDVPCSATLNRFVHRLARAMASLINVLDPDVIVVGGGLSRIEALYTQVPEQWRPFVSGTRTGTRFVPNRHGDSSGVRGAARLWD